jgi:hypothetical protein
MVMLGVGSGVEVLLEQALTLLTELERDASSSGPPASGPDQAGLHRQGAALLAEGAALLAEGAALLAQGAPIHPYDAAAAVWAHRLLVWATAVRAARSLVCLEGS